MSTLKGAFQTEILLYVVVLWCELKTQPCGFMRLAELPPPR